MDDKIVNALVSTDNKVVEKIYDDLVSPANKKLGEALSTVINVTNTILWPVKWGNERVKIFFENNLKNYAQRLEEIPAEKITTVPSEIAIPILERFNYVSNKEISDAFVKLLTTASSSDTVSSAHPGFISIIDRLSPDEAAILKYASQSFAIPYLTLSYYVKGKIGVYISQYKNETAVEMILKLLFPENIHIYFDNLCSLGLMRNDNSYWTEFEDKFDAIEKLYAKKNEHLIPTDDTIELIIGRKRLDKGMFAVTHFGELFIKACIPSMET